MSKVTLVTLTTTGNSAPTVGTDGVAVRRGVAVANEGIASNADEGEILVEAEGSGVVSIAYIRIWAWFPDAIHATNKWFPLGGGAAADKGKINADAAVAYVFAETGSGTDSIRHCERIRGIRECTRLFAEVNTPANTTTIKVTLSSAGGLMSV